MALASGLPIYRDAYNFVGEVLDVTVEFPKKYKFNLGDRLCSDALALLDEIVLANRCRESRLQHLAIVEAKLESVKMLLRMATEKHVITPERQAGLAEMMVSVSRQASGWKKVSQPESGLSRDAGASNQ